MSMKIMQEGTDKVFFHYLLGRIFVIVTSSLTLQTNTCATGLAYTGTKYFYFCLVEFLQQKKELYL